MTAGSQRWRGETWGSSPSASSPGSASFGNENSHPSRGTERRNPAQVQCVRACARAVALGGGGGRQKWGGCTLGISSFCRFPLPPPPRARAHTHAHKANNIFKKLSFGFVPHASCSSLPWAWGASGGRFGMLANCLRRFVGGNAGASLDGSGPRTWLRGGAVVAAPAPVPVCAALWAALAAQCGRGCGRGEGGREREGGREEAAWEESGCVCGREGRPVASCFLSVSAGGGRRGGLAGHQAGQFAGRVCVSLSTRPSTQSFPCPESQRTPELANSRETLHLPLGPYLLNWLVLFLTCKSVSISTRVDVKA